MSMTPLEIMAKAAWNDCYELEYPWESAPQVRRDEAIDNMRAALLALAEAELPESVIAAPYAPLSIRDQAHIDIEALKIAFKSMLRAIAQDRP